jgi:hypothetical protein
VRTRSDTKVVARFRQLQVSEEDVGERRVIVLSRVDKHFLDAAAAELPAEDGGLNELGPGAGDGEDLHA